MRKSFTWSFVWFELAHCNNPRPFHFYTENPRLEFSLQDVRSVRILYFAMEIQKKKKNHCESVMRRPIYIVYRSKQEITAAAKFTHYSDGKSRITTTSAPSLCSSRSEANPCPSQPRAKRRSCSGRREDIYPLYQPYQPPQMHVSS